MVLEFADTKWICKINLSVKVVEYVVDLGDATVKQRAGGLADYTNRSSHGTLGARELCRPVHQNTTQLKGTQSCRQLTSCSIALLAD